jgi:hypothetical protein
MRKTVNIATLPWMPLKNTKYYDFSVSSRQSLYSPDSDPYIIPPIDFLEFNGHWFIVILANTTLAKFSAYKYFPITCTYLKKKNMKSFLRDTVERNTKNAKQQTQ